MKPLIVVLLAVVAAGAQSAVVLPLRTEDSAKVQRLHQQLLDAQKAWDDEQMEIRNKYLIVSPSDPDASNAYWYPDDEPSFGTISVGSAAYSFISPNDGFCETAKEKADRIAAEEKREEDAAKARAARDAAAKRYRKGWEQTHNFQYTGDWKYIVPLNPPLPPTFDNGLRNYSLPALGWSAVN